MTNLPFDWLKNSECVCTNVGAGVEFPMAKKACGTAQKLFGFVVDKNAFERAAVCGGGEAGYC